MGRGHKRGLSGKQAGESIMGRSVLSFGLASWCFYASEDFPSSDEKVDVVKVIAFGWVHFQCFLLTGFCLCVIIKL